MSSYTVQILTSETDIDLLARPLKIEKNNIYKTTVYHDFYKNLQVTSYCLRSREATDAENNKTDCLRFRWVHPLCIQEQTGK